MHVPWCHIRSLNKDTVTSPGAHSTLITQIAVETQGHLSTRNIRLGHLTLLQLVKFLSWHRPLVAKNWTVTTFSSVLQKTAASPLLCSGYCPHVYCL